VADNAGERRAETLGRLGRGLRETAAGKAGQVIFIEGEAGIGKTTMVGHLAVEAAVVHVPSRGGRGEAVVCASRAATVPAVWDGFWAAHVSRTSEPL
jgi:hypothetical protein